MTQESFSTIWHNYASNKEAMQARNKRAKELRDKGWEVSCWTLPNQTREYASLGVPDGRVCNVYMIDVA
jgi:hypothetical protein